MSSSAVGVLPTRRRGVPSSRVHFTWLLQLLIPFTAFTLALLAVKPGLLRPLFPAAVCFVAYRIYQRNESYYLSFLLWIYMLTPLLRRLVDWRVSYQEQSMILLAPLLITLLPMIDLRRRLIAVPPVIRSGALLALSGIVFGAGVGMIKHPGLNVLLAAMTWTAPIVLCIFAASIRERESLSRVLTKTLFWGVLAMSAYGVYQFLVAPPWDAYWLKQISADSVAPSFGQPSPMGMRVWSTMNAPGPFGVWLGAALVWISTLDGFVLVLVSVAGYLALSLTLVRSAWMQTILALLIFACCCRAPLRLRNLATGFVIVILLVYAFVHATQFGGIHDRLQTLTSLRSDGSVNEREAMYNYMGTLIMSTPLGVGLESVSDVHGFPIDSSLIQLFYVLGWLGALSYLAGLSYLLAIIVSNLRSVSREQVAAGAIALAGATQVFTGDILYRQGGVILWLFIGVWASVFFPRTMPAEKGTRILADRRNASI